MIIMSLYNMLFGKNPLTPLLKEVLSLDKEQPEYPDGLTWTDKDGKKYFDPDGDNSKNPEKELYDYVEKCKNLKWYPTGRFRDIYVDDDKIILYTRNGGGNRNSYQWVFDLLETHPNYMRDYDDDFDCTYAYIEFSIPENLQEFMKEIEMYQGDTSKVSEKFQNFIKVMEE